ncbi:MAG: hypothetical protein K0U29_08475 [Gammaproteobacteria bacterium]|nr:hypothetical protein [Gammaproteobacteria bacterium]MCH9744946.1 hypothetical protein [Gammaproteobacteria bacterium]
MINRITKIKHAVIVISLTAGLISTASFAATCPTQLIQDHKGYWLSHEKPGWKSFRVTKHNVSVKVKNFAGAVYSQQRNRMACVYRASDGYFIALVSHKKAKIKPTGKNWRFNKSHGDYACGQPKVKNISGCQFNLK